MYRKYFVCSFDDGLEQDRKITETLREFVMGGTFHINSGLLGKRGYTVRIGDLGLDAPERFDPDKKHLLPHVGHHRMRVEDARVVYQGFEIAAHTVFHPQIIIASEKKLRHQILDDVKALSDIFGQEITGFAFPFGTGSRKSREILREAGIEYARVAFIAKDFSFPEDPLSLHVTAMCLSGNVFEKVDRFLEAKPKDGDLFFLLFAHGYELDFRTRESSWEKFRKILTKVSGRDDVTCCSIGDAFRMHAGKAPVFYPYNQD